MSQRESLRARMQNLEGKRVLVVGLARSGRAAARFFRSRGALVSVSDSRPPWSFEEQIPELLADGIGLEFGQHGIETFVRQDVIVASPGVPWDLPAFAAARERGVPVVAEVEAASWYLKGDLVGVTGSNGKTTTTSLIGRMLEASEIPTWVGGNIGKPLVSMVEQAAEESAVVAELSSFQLEGTESLHPHVAVVLNITPNHLDRHPSFEAYREAKARIFRNQTGADYAVLNADDAAVAALAEEPGRVQARKVYFSRSRELPEGVLVSGGKVVYRVGHLDRELYSPRDVRLRGDFNLENVLAATAAACVAGADFDALGRAVREFRGVEHRLEYAGDVLGVEFYNDSKATSVDATAKALGAFERGVHLILGGKDKGAPYAPLIPLLRERVREVLLIGAASGRIASELQGAADMIQAGDLETAVRRAFERARPGDVVLLSPACSSYDQFTDFEERGRKFKEIVEALAREGEAGRARRSRFEPERGRTPQRAVAPLSVPQPTSPAEPLRPASPGSPLALGEPSAPESANPSPAVETVADAGSLAPALAASEVSGAGEADDTAEPAAAGSPSAQPEAAPGAAGEDAGTSVGRPLAEIPANPPAIEIEAAPVPRERVYVYELDAEERPPLDVEPVIALDEIELDRGEQPDTLEDDRGGRGKATLAGEPFIFEVAAAPAESPAADARPQPEARRAGARKRSARHSKGAVETQGASGDDSQDRFPGM